MPRVLFVTQTHSIWGGMEQWLHNFTLWLAANSNWQVDVGLARGVRFNDPARFHREHPHLCAHVLDARVGTESSRVHAIVRAIRKLDPDLLVPISLGAVFPAVAAAKRDGSKVRLLVPVRSLASGLFANIEDFLPIVDSVAGVSRLIETYLAQRFPSESARLHYVRHGVKPTFAPRVETPNGPLRIGYVGRFDPIIKRVLDAVPLVPELERLHANVELHLFGNGPADAELRAALAQRETPVIFHGYFTQYDLYTRAYPALDALLLFSSEEGTPNAVCEAMHHGVVPVITRYLGQTRERFVIDGQNGFTFDVGDINAAAARVAELSRDRALLQRMSAAARRDVADDVDDRMHRDWLRIFETTLAQPQKCGDLERLASTSGAGRLDRVLSPTLADRIRNLLRKWPAFADGWGEWPGTQPVGLEREERIRAELLEIDARDRKAMPT